MYKMMQNRFIILVSHNVLQNIVGQRTTSKPFFFTSERLAAQNNRFYMWCTIFLNVNLLCSIIDDALSIFSCRKLLSCHDSHLLVLQQSVSTSICNPDQHMSVKTCLDPSPLSPTLGRCPKMPFFY